MPEHLLETIRSAAEFMLERGADANRGEKDLWAAIASPERIIALLDELESKNLAQEKAA